MAEVPMRPASDWGTLGFVARVAIVTLTGLSWAVRSVQEILVHPEYWDPVTVADFFAVYSYSAAWLLTAASLLILREAVRPTPTISTVMLAVAAASAVTGVANGVEDGFGLKGFGLLYVVGALVSGLGMLIIAAMFWTSPARRLTFVPAVGAISMVTVVIGGGALALIAWLGFGVILIRERLGAGTAPPAAQLDG